MDDQNIIEEIKATQTENFSKEEKVDPINKKILNKRPSTTQEKRIDRIKKLKKSQKVKQQRRNNFVLDGIKVGKEKIDGYNSLLDKHLIYFFKKKKVFKHLVHMKIV